MIARRAAVLAVVAVAACSRGPRRSFPVGVLEPVSPRAAAAIRSLGLEIAERAPAGAATVDVALPVEGGGRGVAAGRARLRFLTASAVLGDPSGIFFRLPDAPAGRDFMDYIEESQAADRTFRELMAVRPILRDGAPVPVPFVVPAGMGARAWTFHGRRYVLLVNPTSAPLPLEEGVLASSRALFSVRSDPRQILAPCGTGSCLPAGDALWLEGRFALGILR